MKKAVGMVEILLVIIVITVLYFTCFHSKYGRSNQFDDNSNLNNQQEMIDNKIQDIENTKALKQKIEDNLNKGY